MISHSKRGLSLSGVAFRWPPTTNDDDTNSSASNRRTDEISIDPSSSGGRNRWRALCFLFVCLFVCLFFRWRWGTRDQTTTSISIRFFFRFFFRTLVWRRLRTSRPAAHRSATSFYGRVPAGAIYKTNPISWPRETPSFMTSRISGSCLFFWVRLISYRSCIISPLPTAVRVGSFLCFVCLFFFLVFFLFFFYDPRFINSFVIRLWWSLLCGSRPLLFPRLWFVRGWQTTSFIHWRRQQRARNAIVHYSKWFDSIYSDLDRWRDVGLWKVSSKRVFFFFLEESLFIVAGMIVFRWRKGPLKVVIGISLERRQLRKCQPIVSVLCLWLWIYWMKCRAATWLLFQTIAHQQGALLLPSLRKKKKSRKKCL